MAMMHIILSITGLAMSSLCLALMPAGPSVMISRHPYANTTTDALGLDPVALECRNVRCLSEFLSTLIRHPLCRQTDLFISVPTTASRVAICDRT
jgi:hypothetical protein